MRIFGDLPPGAHHAVQVAGNGGFNLQQPPAPFAGLVFIKRRLPLTFQGKETGEKNCSSLMTAFLIPIPGYLEKTSVLDFVEAAPTGVFFSNLDLPDKRIPVYTGSDYDNHLHF